MKPKDVLAWHFLRDDWTTGQCQLLVKPGQTLVHTGRLEPCSSGLHASTRLIDALYYAPGNVITLVRCIPPFVSESDKFVCHKRKALFGYNAEAELREFARIAALSALQYWRQPVPSVVVDYLETGDESIRSAAARAAAWSAESARAAADSAAWSAESAAQSAARAAARSAARDEQNCLLESLILDGAIRRGLLED